MKRRAGNALVGLLAAVAIVAILVVVFMNGGLAPRESTRADGKGVTVLGAAKYKAKDTVCKERLNQVRQGIMVFQTSNDGFPEELKEIRIGGLMYSCPIGKEAYTYDPKTGEVHCPHPGHENY